MIEILKTILLCTTLNLVNRGVAHDHKLKSHPPMHNFEASEWKGNL